MSEQEYREPTGSPHREDVSGVGEYESGTDRGDGGESQSGSAQDFRGRGPRGYQRSGDRVREDICEWLTDDPDVDASEIEVDVDEGIVTLRGTVADRRQKRRAEDIAERARGVRDVRNQLELQDADLADDLAGRVAERSAAEGGGAHGLGEFRDPEWSSADFRGFDVDTRDGSIGTVDKRTEVGSDHLVVDTGTWIFGKKVVLPAGLVERVDFNEQRVFVNRSQDEIKNAPEFDEDRFDDPSYGEELRAYYGGARAGEQPVRR